jgi:hypothetical protein
MMRTSITHKQAQTVAQMTAGKRFWHRPKSATVGIAQTKLMESYGLCKGGQKRYTGTY